MRLRSVFVSMVAAAACSIAAAEPVRAVLFVQNHATGGMFDRPLTDLEAMLSEALSSGGALRIVTPADVVGVDQNRNPAGDVRPESSTVRLAENCGAWLMVTASFNGISVRSYGNPVFSKQLTARATIEAKCVPGGESVGGVTVGVKSRRHSPEDFEANLEGIYEELAGDLCRQAAGPFLKRVSEAVRPAEASEVSVAFGCNAPGAKIEIDGVAYGAVGVGSPLRVRLSRGLHHLVFSHPYMIPYDATVMLREDSSFMVSLELTEEGRLRAKDEDGFRASLERTLKSGEVDDAVRREVAEGRKAYLSASFKRLSGMPETLAIGADVAAGVFDLEIDEKGDGKKKEER